MTQETILELVGYLGSALVVISLLMSSVVKLRVLNLIGSLIFAGYALLIRSYPTAVMNFCLVIINIYYLAKLRRTQVSLNVRPARREESGVTVFLQTWQADILAHFPHFFDGSAQGEELWMVYGGANPVGILVGSRQPDGSLEISLDYTTPEYRDCSVGTFLYPLLFESGVTKLIAPGGSAAHCRYLKKMGFRQAAGRWEKTPG